MVQIVITKWISQHFTISNYFSGLVCSCKCNSLGSYLTSSWDLTSVSNVFSPLSPSIIFFRIYWQGRKGKSEIKRKSVGVACNIDNHSSDQNIS